MKYVDEKMEIIFGLENTIQKLKLKNKKYNEEKSEVAKQYQSLKQKYLKLVFKIFTIIHYTSLLNFIFNISLKIKINLKKLVILYPQN